uniref:Synaptosomal-associated protein n=1 Tax=Syphacia muris TaxID=451379 RepID=A0A0N5ANM7_9BILA
MADNPEELLQVMDDVRESEVEEVGQLTKQMSEAVAMENALQVISHNLQEMKSKARPANSSIISLGVFLSRMLMKKIVSRGRTDEEPEGINVNCKGKAEKAAVSKTVNHFDYKHIYASVSQKGIRFVRQMFYGGSYETDKSHCRKSG